MRRLAKKAWPPMQLLDLLDALSQELIIASDDEVLEVAQGLGMNLGSRESAAFAGILYPSRPTVADFFTPESPEVRSDTQKLPSARSPRKPTRH